MAWRHGVLYWLFLLLRLWFGNRGCCCCCGCRALFFLFVVDDRQIVVRVQLPALKEDQLSLGHFFPSRFARERFGRHHRHAIVGRGDLGKINATILVVNELGLQKGRLTNDVVQSVPHLGPRPGARPAVSKEGMGTAGEQKVENGGHVAAAAVVIVVVGGRFHNFLAQLREEGKQFRFGRQLAGRAISFTERIENGAKNGFAVGPANRLVIIRWLSIISSSTTVVLVR
mmetsp:Transcript_7755/g.16033  ORF Transcript_7755/g.16033 Transcript_7755/m.16033 type:complete len:228 (+) Transcript_7755:1509-2192(+)